MSHAPVMLTEVLESLAPKADEVYVDGTFGGGGYTQAVLQAANCKVVGIDRDLDAITRAERLAAQNERFTPILGRFGDLDAQLLNAGIESIDGLMLDIGVSSYQLDQAERGFSFMREGPLDMRMGQTGPSAADVINYMPQADLVRVIRSFGEEKQARRIVHAIADRRRVRPFTQTLDLADLVETTLGGRRGRKTHPATQTFQAIRIYVNDELGELARGLEAAERMLAAGGRLVVVTFHSLEDRLVKQFLRQRSGGNGQGSRYRPAIERKVEPSFELSHRKALLPSEADRDGNPRARSARLRAAIRLPTPAWTAPFETGFSLPPLTALEVPA